MSARAAGYARLSGELIAVGVTYGDADSFARSVGPCARRSANHAPMAGRSDWAWIGVDYSGVSGSASREDGRNLSFGFLVAGAVRAAWQDANGDESRAMMRRWSRLAHSDVWHASKVAAS